MLNVKKILLGIICLVVLSGIIIGGKYLISVRNYQRTIKGLTINKVDLSKIPDGKYIGSYDVNLISAKVSVTVKNHKIENIDLLEHKTDRGKPAEVIPDMVVKAQSLQVDNISGATNSSKTILKAIENALKPN
ncbi:MULTISPECIES: FMN-binding protein [Clostridium]|uniref:FMN-binding protein n=1 Tax=Clostridium beijerinckii TaxID=1520 RepID=A0A1S9N0Z6_CLOBE|nr:MULTISPECIES: FMN-binding protein [Clostridium]MBN7575871.1 FMN-binding protein [Clostridium beijerinckii]MBN7580961.1 FMN-binding protein [Clostridium beijerinckii]MBN7585592.1 FMN-binding protein [Clostridium beijerinckii]MBO0522043.1 FMN-binding protein [Clostridium beijerinckii]MZK49350.1 FMN-binding protein [Clostridium beijerinckii]